MKTCPRCNQTMDDSFTLCGSCGAPLLDGEPEFGDETTGSAAGEDREEMRPSLSHSASEDHKEEQPPQHLSPFGSGTRAKPSPFHKNGEELGSFERTRSSERPNLPNLTSQPVQSMRKNKPTGYPDQYEAAAEEGGHGEDDFVPIPPFASHEAQMESPFKSSAFKSNSGSNASESRPAPAPRVQPAPVPSSPNSIFDSNKTGYEHTKPCPRCGAMTFPYDEKCISCGYRLMKIRRINVGAVIAALAYAVCVLLPFISAKIAGTSESLTLLGTTEGYLVFALSAIVFVIALTGRNAFIVALGGISLMLSFYISSVRVYQIAESKWGEAIFKNDISYYLLYAASVAILITGLVGLVNSIGRNREKTNEY